MITDDPVLRQAIEKQMDRIEHVHRAQNKLSEALHAYQQDLEIAKRLADQDPSNVGWQRDLIVAYYRIGKCLAKMGGRENSDQANNLLHTGLDLARSYDQQDLINAFNEVLDSIKSLNH
jgi:hypothetical protein